MGLPDRLRELEYEYTLDQRELGKVLLVVSAAVFLVSLTSLLNARSALQDVEEMSNDFSQLDAVISSDRFNESLSAIESLEGTVDGEEYQYAIQTFRGMQHGLNEVNSAESKLQRMQNFYRWLILISILCATAGVTVIFL